jgi:predicted metal-binding membrane protein
VVAASRQVRRTLSGIVTRRAFYAVSAIVFAASAAMTITWGASMSSMGEMSMPGGWAMSHLWMLMPGQTWFGAGASFVGMWVVMMVAMMMPSLTPTLWRYHQGLREADTARAGRLTTLVGVAYFLVWSAVGVVVFPLSVSLADIAMRLPALARVVPLIVGAAVLIAGIVQHTEWKARHLALCREPSSQSLTPEADAAMAWHYGLCLGWHCIQSCAALTAVAFALGVMDLRVMAVVATVITVERLTPASVRVTQAIRVVIVGTGLLLCARAIGG